MGRTTRGKLIDSFIILFLYPALFCVHKTGRDTLYPLFEGFFNDFCIALFLNFISTLSIIYPPIKCFLISEKKITLFFSCERFHKYYNIQSKCIKLQHPLYILVKNWNDNLFVCRKFRHCCVYKIHSVSEEYATFLKKFSL